MPVTDATRKALDPQELQLPESLPIVRLEVDEYIDSDGEPSLRILAVIDESVDLEHVQGRDVGELKSQIRHSLRRQGVDLFPYVFLAKPSELNDADDRD